MDDKIKKISDIRIRKIANYYGLKNQLNQTVEECAELIVAIQKYIRYENDANANIDELEVDIIMEIADVEIMTEQLKYLFGLIGLCEVHKLDKEGRQLERIKNEKEEK